MREETLGRLRALGFPTYEAYLDSDLWRANKYRLGLKRPTKCWACPATTELHAHHCSYANVGNEQPGELITLCSRCHSEVHKLVNRGAPLLTAHLSYAALFPDGVPAPRRTAKKKPKPKRKKNKPQKQVVREPKPAIKGPRALQPEREIDKAKQKARTDAASRMTKKQRSQARLTRIQEGWMGEKQRDRAPVRPEKASILTPQERRRIRKMVESAQAQRDRQNTLTRQTIPRERATIIKPLDKFSLRAEQHRQGESDDEFDRRVRRMNER